MWLQLFWTYPNFSTIPLATFLALQIQFKPQRPAIWGESLPPMPIQDIALSQLELSPLNVHKTRSKRAIEQMAVSIGAVGILQNLRVHETEGGKFGVAIGGTKLEALRLLLNHKKTKPDYLVPCDVRQSEGERFRGLSEPKRGSSLSRPRTGRLTSPVKGSRPGTVKSSKSAITRPLIE